MSTDEKSEPINAAVESDDVIIEVEPGPGEPPPIPMKLTTNLPTRSYPPKVVADLMTRRVIALREGEQVGELEAWMDRLRFRHVPVVGEGMKLVGLITRTDYLHAAIGVGPTGEPIEKATATTKAGAIMRKGVVTAKPDADLAMALEVMLREKIGCLPVILEDGTLVGILTETDFARLALAVLKK
jgi:CBS domain-containing protein